MTIGPWWVAIDWSPFALTVLAVSGVVGWLERRAGRGWPESLLRALIVALLAVALARPELVRGRDAAVVVLVDASASVSTSAVEAATRALDVSRSAATVMRFGDATTSSLADAIDLAARALPGGGRIVVVSDLLATGDDPIAAASRAAAVGCTVEVVPLSAVPKVDVAIAALSVPPVHRAGDLLPINLSVVSTEPATATLRISVNGRAVVTTPLAFRERAERLIYRALVHAEGPGPAYVSAEVGAPGDVEVRNDRAEAVAMPAPPLSVLVVGEDEGAVTLADHLVRSGARATVVGAAYLPARLSALAKWDALVLVDVPARSLGVDQLAAVESFAADLGRGVVLTGGRQSFIAGGWQGTTLADMSPCRLEPPAHRSRDPVALLLMVDQSASMGTADSRTGISKLDLAREAAMLATEVLHPGDSVGVVAYDDAARWLVPISTVGAGRDLAAVEAALSGLASGGGTRILGALELGLPALARLEPRVRHAVLLSDGRDFSPDVARYEAVVRQARAGGVTLSTIALGFDADRELLERLARLGRGRYHSADDPSDLPRLAVEESEIARAATERHDTFSLRVVGEPAHPALAGIDITALPALGGYLALGPRDAAEVVLATPDGDPVLATWQYGLGRVAAWTSDVGENWASDWRADAAAGAFWRRIVGYVARAPEVGDLAVSVRRLAGGADVTIDARDGAGGPRDLLDVTLVVTTTDGPVGVTLVQDSPGLYAGKVSLPGDGAYPGTALVVDGGSSTSVPAPMPWQHVPELVTVSGPRPEALAGAGAGRVWSETELPLALPAAQPTRHALWPWLVALAALAWPVDVWRQLGGRWASRSRRRRQ